MKKKIIFLPTLLIITIVLSGCNKKILDDSKPIGENDSIILSNQPKGDTVNSDQEESSEEGNIVSKVSIIDDKELTNKNDLGKKIKEFTMIAKNWSFDPATITVNKGDTVKLNIKSVDVDHGIALPEFGISETIKAGKESKIEFIANKTGEFTFSCSVFCGEGHKAMKGKLIVK